MTHPHILRQIDQCEQFLGRLGCPLPPRSMKEDFATPWGYGYYCWQIGDKIINNGKFIVTAFEEAPPDLDDCSSCLQPIEAGEHVSRFGCNQQNHSLHALCANRLIAYGKTPRVRSCPKCSNPDLTRYLVTIKREPPQEDEDVHEVYSHTKVLYVDLTLDDDDAVMDEIIPTLPGIHLQIQRTNEREAELAEWRRQHDQNRRVRQRIGEREDVNFSNV